MDELIIVELNGCKVYWAKDVDAEITRLHDVIDRAAKAWLEIDHRIAWEGDLADAMQAAVKEIIHLRTEVERLQGTRLALNNAELIHRNANLERQLAEAEEQFEKLYDKDHAVTLNYLEADKERVDLRAQLAAANRDWEQAHSENLELRSQLANLRSWKP